MATEQTPTSRQQISNPYDTTNRAKYKMGKIETFLHDTLGFRTGIDKYNEEMNNASAAWLAQQENNAFEEQYNSAEQQAARLRAAGINPDINGEVQPGQATEFTEPESAPESPAGVDTDTFASACEISARIASVALDAITGSAGIFSTITNAAIGLGKGALEIDTKEAELGAKLREAANESYGEFENVMKGLGDLAGGAEWGAATFGQAGKFIAKARGLSGKNAKKFASMYNAMVHSATAKMKTLEKQGKLTELSANPAVAAPYLYKQVEMAKAKHDAKVYDILLWKAEQEQRVLRDNPELFRGMTAAEMRNKIHQAVITENQAEIAKYEKVIKELDKVDREAEQKQNNEDREFIANFKFGSGTLGGNSMFELEEYRNAMERVYGKTPSYGIRALTGM